MKQVLQDLQNGETIVEDVPAPERAGHGKLLISTRRSLVSTGTERMLVDFGRAGFIDKARQQPDKVRQVLDKVKTDGLAPTVRAVQNKLSTPLPMGYSNVGVVLEVGEGVQGFAVGDRVVSNGKHAEIVAVPQNLCARIPDAVSDDDAAFTVLGAIALQGVRLVQPTLGECVVVTGLGLIGLLTVQLLRAHGCRVLGIDLDAAKIEQARALGAETANPAAGDDVLAAAAAFSRGRGVDAVILTASTKSSEPVHQAATMCRQRGRIVLVGVTGLELSRADFYEKELTFQVSCSYGPGRYDPAYEEGGQDYPVGFVRWTEQRNFEAFLDMLAEQRVSVGELVSHRYAIEKAGDAYAVISNGTPSLGILLEYAADQDDARRAPSVQVTAAVAGADKPVIGFIGSGNYASQILIPAFAKTGARMKMVASAQGVSGVHAAKKLGIEEACTSADAVIDDPDINTVVISTRHDSHARFVIAALEAGKHVFVEKPLTLTRTELEAVQAACGKAATPGGGAPVLMVGFNRRFAPHVLAVKQALSGRNEPKHFLMTVNAGAIPADHWTQDRGVGGGRIIGEGCHFVDLLRHLAGAAISGAQSFCVGEAAGMAVRDDKTSMILQFADGSVGTILYLANGHRAFPKERLEVFSGGAIAQLDNFRRLNSFGWPGLKSQRLWQQDKGQTACVAAFVDAIRQGAGSPITAAELFEVARVTFDLADQLPD